MITVKSGNGKWKYGKKADPNISASPLDCAWFFLEYIVVQEAEMGSYILSVCEEILSVPFNIPDNLEKGSITLRTAQNEGYVVEALAAFEALVPVTTGGLTFRLMSEEPSQTIKFEVYGTYII